MPSPPFTPEERARYARQMSLAEIGEAGQRRIRDASVAVVGAGGLGAPVLAYLAAAGVGRVVVADPDRVEASNLHRQVLYAEADVGRPKVEVAAARLRASNASVEVDTVDAAVDASNARQVIGDVDVVVDGTDRITARYLLNDACALLGKPYVYASLFRFEGHVSTFHPPHGPCYRCLYPEPPRAGAVPSCAEAGVVGPVPGIVGSIQALEALKIVAGVGASLVGRMLVVDAGDLSFREIALRRVERCPLCGTDPTVREIADVALAEDRPEAEPAAAVSAELPFDATVEELNERMNRGEAPLVLDVRTPMEWNIGRIEGAKLLPIQELEARVSELDPSRETVVYCHVGGRSAMAARWLRARGFSGARNLVGGIDRWSRVIDPDVPRY